VSADQPPLPEERRLLFTPDLRAAVLAAEPTADLDAASVLGEGWSCVAWRVPRQGGHFALRVPKPGAWWAKSDLEREARLLPALEEWGLAVPRGARLLRGAGGDVLGAVQSIIEGVAATRLPRGAARLRFAQDVGAFLARLHAQPLDAVRALGVKDPGMWDGFYAPLIERAASVLPPTSARWLRSRAAAFLESGGMSPAPSVLIHADYSGDHLLIGLAGSLYGVIDWADAMIGDPALDVAALLHDYPARFVAVVVDAYERSGGALDPDWARRAAFYLDVAPVFGVLMADDAGFPKVARQDRRRFAAAAGRTSKGRT
jgi:aminoglycoside phosphotransferase (APT) family kinase protein